VSRPVRFTQADLKRAVAGATAAGMLVGRIEIEPNGKIVILPRTDKPTHDNDEWADLA
jgi:hypothetical protein